MLAYLLEEIYPQLPTVFEFDVRASAAIFFFPAVRLGNRYYDGGLRMNTPLSPALRLGCERLLIIGLKHPVGPDEDQPAYPEDVIGKPAFPLGKVLRRRLC